MRKQLLIIVLIISFNFSPHIFANIKSNVNTTFYSYNNYGEKFTFVENGITFSVFQNGEFDFYINPRNGLHTNINFGAVNISYNSGYNYNAYVQYDDYGAIIQIENVPIYYDYYGRITQVGNVNVNYFNNRLARIGGLQVYYNTYGHYSHYAGYINQYNRYYVFNPFHNFFVRPHFNRCIVSYNPYRRYYSPYRYEYGSFNYNKKYYKNYNHNKKRAFRKVDSRISSNNSGIAYQKRSANSNNRNMARNSTSNRGQSSKAINNYNRNSTKNNSHTNKQVSNRNVKTQRNNTSYKNDRITHNNKKEKITRSHRTVTNRNSTTKNVKQNKTVQRNFNNKQTKNANKRSVTQRNSYDRSSSNKRSIKKLNSKKSSKRAVAQRN